MMSEQGDRPGQRKRRKRVSPEYEMLRPHRSSGRAVRLWSELFAVYRSRGQRLKGACRFLSRSMPLSSAGVSAATRTIPHRAGCRLADHGG